MMCWIGCLKIIKRWIFAKPDRSVQDSKQIQNDYLAMAFLEILDCQQEILDDQKRLILQAKN